MAVNAYQSQLYLWKKRTLYIGEFSEPLKLSQGAATLSVSLGEPCSFQVQGMLKPIHTKSLIIPAGLTVRVDTKDSLIANCHLDVLGQDFYYLFAQAQNNCCQLGYDLEHEGHLIERFSSMFNTQMQSKEAFEYLENTLTNKCDSPLPPFPIDSRIEKVIETIQATVNDTITGEALAESVNLSIPRLAQVFKKQTGIPIRRYRLWHRLYITAQNVGLGKNLTDAALDAGFTDSPHFTHTFKAMLGITPSYILSQVNKTRIII